jgi:myosin heavy subunit
MKGCKPFSMRLFSKVRRIFILFALIYQGLKRKFYNILGEMKMYVADGVNCDDITFQDNVDCVRLIDLKGSGIFSILGNMNTLTMVTDLVTHTCIHLDEQVILPGGSDDKFLQKLNQIFDENAATKSLYYVRNRRKPKGNHAHLTSL